MTAHAAFGGQRRDLGDRVDHAVRERRRRPHHNRRPLGHRIGQRTRIGPEATVDRDPDQRHVEEPGGLVERGVRGDRRDDLRRGDAAALAGKVAVGLHRQQDALGPAGTHRAGHRRFRRGVAGSEHGRGHRHDFRLELGGAGPQVRMERVALRLRRVYPAQERHVFRITVVDGSGRVAVTPGVFLGRGQLLDQAGHFGPGQAFGRQFGEGRERVPVRLELALQVGHRVGHDGPPSRVMVAAPRAGSLVASASPARQATERAPSDR